MKILALMKYGDRAASTRQRLLQYRPVLAENGFSLECIPLLDNRYLEGLFNGTAISLRMVAGSYVSRALRLIRERKIDLLWIHCEVFPYFPGFAERLAFLGGKPIIYDFDDAIFHQYDKHRNVLVRHILGRKLEKLLRGSAVCFCGNEYLRAYTRRFCPRSVTIPTVVDTSIVVPGARRGWDGDRTVIGWVGSPSTWKYVDPVMQVIRRLTRDGKALMRVIGSTGGSPTPDFEFRDWSEETEVAELQRLHIGVMPLPDDPWSRGKCGYKLIQYMACGLPVVASPIGVNREIVEHGVNGFLAETPEEWEQALRTLLADPQLRERMGRAGRRKVEKHYSLQVTGPRVVALLQSVLGAS